MRSQYSGGSYYPANVVHVINYIVDTIEAVTQAIRIKQACIPMAIKHFLRAIHDDGVSQGQSAGLIYRRIADYLVREWIGKVSFVEMVENGFVKAYHLKSTSY